MTEDTIHVPIHPVAPRMLNSHITPHIGPNIQAYRAAHAETVGQDSDKWWGAVSERILPLCSMGISLTGGRLLEKHFPGIVHSKPLDRAASKQEILFGFPRAPSTRLTTALTVGHINTLTRFLILNSIPLFYLLNATRRLPSFMKLMSLVKAGMSRMLNFFVKYAASPTPSRALAHGRATQSPSTCP